MAACLADIPCGNSGDCEAGQRCNLAVDEPVCGVIRCGASGDPCSEAELCSDDMACLDPTTFGTETLSAAGRCHTGEEARALCVAKCLEVPQEQGVPCDGSFLSQMCEHACAQYPEGWDAECLEQWPGDLSGFSFDKAACVPDVDHVGCFLDLLCDGHRMTFDVPCE